jgi:hypothetical protein
MQPPKKMAEEVLGRWSVARLWYGVQNEHEKQLEAVRDQYLSLVSKDNMVVRHTPCGRIVLECLAELAYVLGEWWQYQQY